MFTNAIRMGQPRAAGRARLASAERPVAPPGRQQMQRAPAPCACGGSCPRCQAKSTLTIGPGNDAFERQADAVADQVLGIPAHAVAPHVAPAASGIQRKCAACENHEEREEEQLTVRRKADPGGEAALATVDVESVLSSPGHALDAATRGFFDTRFGYDFSAVRVHADAAAAQSARAINSLAYTSGHDIVFGAGRYAPDTHEGKRLLAHELTHVVQQAGGAVPPARLQRQEADDGIDIGAVDPSTGAGRPLPEFGERTAEPACPSLPTHLGDLRPDPPCPTAAIGNVVGTHFHFCTDSDVFIDQQQVDRLRIFARAQRSDSLFKAHGFASTEGQAAYNLRLSCHRAKRAARELQNAGVPSQQIRIAAMGETSDLGATPADNQAVVVGAEAPTGQTTPEAGGPVSGLRDAADQAIDRLVARDYRLAADAYVSRWTCGTIPSVAEMVRRTTVLVEDQNSSARLRPTSDPTEDPRMGRPLRTGLREIVLAREVASEADSPVLCAAARIVDMAFHHFVAPRLGLDIFNKPMVHEASAFLVELAGFPPCRNPAGVDPVTGLVLIPAAIWWRVPATDPLAGVLPPCPGQPLPGPTSPQQQGGHLPAPLTFSTLVFEPRGSAALVTPRVDESQDRLTIASPAGAFRFRATVQASGDASQFPRYTVGFVQTVIADETVASYVSGHAIHMGVPTPIRDGPPASLAGPPWYMPPRVRQLDAAGTATVDFSDSPSATMPLTFTDLSRLSPQQPVSATVQPGNDLNRATVRTTFHTWVVARRDDAPLDRFSTHFIEGRETTFEMDLEMLGRRGEAREESRIDPAPLTDSTPMQIAGPTPADVRPMERVSHVEQPPPRGEVPNAADNAEIWRQVRNVADELAPLRTALHLDGPLMVRVRFDPASGRLALDTPERPATVVEERGEAGEREGVSEGGRRQLAREFTVRLRKDLVAAPGVPALAQGFATALLALPSFAARRRLAAAEPNPWAPVHGIGLLAQIRESQELARSDEELRNNPGVYDPTMFPRVEVSPAQESYCYDFTVSGLDISAVCADPGMGTDGCVRAFPNPDFAPRSNPTFVRQQLGGEIFNSPVALHVTVPPVRFVLYTPRENMGGGVFNHEMHHMIDNYNMVQNMKDRMARRIRARLMQARALAASNPDLKDALLSRTTILEIVQQENQPFVDFLLSEMQVRGNALHAREAREDLPPYRTALPPDWTTFREPAFGPGTRGSLDDNPCT